jgi:tetratricopeptide (TPR) repeat protein
MVKGHLTVWRLPRAHWTPVAIAFVILVAFAHSASGQRATEEQMDAATKTLDEYLKDVRTNYVAVDALLLKRGKVDTQEVVARLSEQRDAAAAPLAKAIYSYLLARAYYWSGFRQFKATRNQEVFAGLAPKAFREFLVAFEEVRSLEASDPVTGRVRADIVGAFAMTLSANLWGARLSAEDKQRAVAEFVDVAEKVPEDKAAFPSGTGLSRMYRNLGIEDRLSNLLPAELPKTPQELFNLLRNVRGAVPDAQLLPVLEAIERDDRAELERFPDRSAVMADIYKSIGQTDKAFGYVGLAASKDAKYYLDVYLLSFGAKPDMSATERETYLAKFLDGASLPSNDNAVPAARRYARGRAYSTAISALRQAGRYEECLALIGQYEKDDSFKPEYIGPPSIVLDKACCLDKLGDAQAALAAYEAFLAEAESLPDGWYARGREMAKRRVQELTGK